MNDPRDVTKAFRKTMSEASDVEVEFVTAACEQYTQHCPARMMRTAVDLAERIERYLAQTKGDTRP